MSIDYIDFSGPPKESRKVDEVNPAVGLLGEIVAQVKRGNRINRQIRFTMTFVIYCFILLACAVIMANIPGAEPEARMGQILLAIPMSAGPMSVFLTIRSVLTWTE